MPPLLWIRLYGCAVALMMMVLHVRPMSEHVQWVITMRSVSAIHVHMAITFAICTIVDPVAVGDVIASSCLVFAHANVPHCVMLVLSCPRGRWVPRAWGWSSPWCKGCWGRSLQCTCLSWICVWVLFALWQFQRATPRRVVGECCQTATVTSATFLRSCHHAHQAAHCPMQSARHRQMERRDRRGLLVSSVLTTTSQHLSPIHGLMVLIV